jgi:L-cysteine desulfidase
VVKLHKNDDKYRAYMSILRKELVPSMGCTEPASLALAAASARDVLEGYPDNIVAEVSGNIIKNTKSVVVPNTGGMKGIPAAIAAGIVMGRSELGLEVLSQASEKDKNRIKSFLNTHTINVIQSNSGIIFDIMLSLSTANNNVRLRICNRHTDIVFIEKDGKIILNKTISQSDNAIQERCKYDMLNIADIVDFVDSVELADISALIERQIVFNSAIGDEGMRHNYGANIGKVLLETQKDIRTRAKAIAASASDARMSGCEMPVIVLSGSGNQGITASLPIVEYAKDLNVSQGKLIRAVTLSNLVTLHQKRYIGRLSAYCGVVCAGAACGAGIAYLNGGGYREIAHTIVNALAICSGILCDGAKPSCAAKIAVSVENGILGYDMFRNGQEFHAGEGIVKNDVEKTIENIGVIGRVGMRETDATVIDLMLEDII